MTVRLYKEGIDIWDCWGVDHDEDEDTYGAFEKKEFARIYAHALAVKYGDVIIEE